MSTTKLGRRAIAILAGFGIAASAISGCAATQAAPPGDYPSLTLAQTKSPAQLLRNIVLLRISRVLVNNVDTQTDRSLACMSTEEDPAGTIRRWESGAEIVLEEWKAQNADDITADVVTTFVEDGWTQKADGNRVLLSKEDSLVSLSLLPDESSGLITLTVVGPCVATDGAESDEVQSIE